MKKYNLSSTLLCELKLEDIAELVDESKTAFLAPASAPSLTTRELLDEFKTDPKFKIFGYVVDQKPISYIIALSGKQPEVVAIGPLYVSHLFRGKGLGKRQAEDFCKLYKDLGYTTIYTKTWSKNKSSRAIFDSLGFVQVGIVEADRVDGDSSIGFELQVR